MRFTAAMIIPTGIGASIGGYGGDGAMALQLLAACCDTLITHPNVANAALFQNLPANAWYVEGFGLDQFFQGRWALSPVRRHAIGVVFDAAIEPRMLTYHHNVIRAVETIYGVSIANVLVTDTSAELTITLDKSGASSGAWQNPECVLTPCQELIAHGATALAICLKMPELPPEAEARYRQGQGTDPIGGLEALVSHTVSNAFGLPCAHVPVFDEIDAQPEMATLLDPKIAPEFIGSSFLPCVLMGLRRAPTGQPIAQATRESLSIKDVNAVVLPSDSLGGIPALCALENGIPIIAVSENKTTMAVHPEGFLNSEGIIFVSTYYEAAGVLMALKSGLPLPKSTVSSGILSK